MSVRNLEKLLNPGSVALIGASRRPRSVGAVLAENLLSGGFEGPVYPVHPKHDSVHGVAAYPDVASLPAAPDLAVIATPPETVAGLIGELGAKGTKAAVVVTAGFGEGEDAAGDARQREVLEAARPHMLRVAGPNCVGLLSPRIGLNASFAHIGARPGKLAFVTQSGAMVTTLLDWAKPRGIGFSHMVSLGDMADVDFGDLLDFLATDPETRAVLLYMEAVTNARKFMSALRACARLKPVIIIKGGRHAAAAKAATSHTGALAGSDAIYDAAFKRAGALRVSTLEELFDAAETLSKRLAAGKAGKLVILTNGGGLGVLATDALLDEGGALAELSEETLAKLDARLPATWSRANPVDIIGDADGARYAAALSAILEDRAADAVLVMNCPVAVADPLDAAKAVAELAATARRPILTAWLGEEAPAAARQLFYDKGIPSYDSPDRAARGFMHLVRYRRSQELLRETPPLPKDGNRLHQVARSVVDRALMDERGWLSEAESKTLLEAYGVPTVETRVVPTLERAVEAADDLGYPVVLKILSPDITHKSDVGGVALDLEDAAALKHHGKAMLARVAEAEPDAEIEGFTVQRLCRRPGAVELILGMSEDQQFGPVILFGAGGTAVELLDDKALALPPLNLLLAERLMQETRVFRLLSGYRDTPAADLQAIKRALVSLSQMAADLPEVVEVDVNPLLADRHGVVALDARVRIQPAKGPRAQRFAIRPYPEQLERRIALADGAAMLIRPIRPEDEPALQAGFKKLTPEDVRFRFFTVMGELSHDMAARLTQIDYDREMALVAEREAGSGDLWGVARLAADPDDHAAEFAIVVRSDMKGRGIGHELMTALIGYAKAKGINLLWGDVMATNRTMLEMMRGFGFTVTNKDPETKRVTLRLNPDDD